MKALLAANIRSFVNLMEEDETNHAGQPLMPYDDAVREYCREAFSCRHPIKDLCFPAPAAMLAILDFIDRSLKLARSTYVHCWGGVGRTGTVVGCSLLRHRLATPEDFVRVLDTLRQQDRGKRQRVSPETAEQQWFVRHWLSNDNGR